MKINPNVTIYYVTYFNSKGSEIMAYKRFSPVQLKEELKKLGYAPKRIVFDKRLSPMNGLLIAYYKDISVMEGPIWSDWNFNGGIQLDDLKFLNKRLGLPEDSSFEKLKEIMINPFKVKIALASQEKNEN